jgi:hypothetical protein
MDCILVGHRALASTNARPGIYYSQSRKQFFLSYSEELPYIPLRPISETFIPITIEADNTFMQDGIRFPVAFDQKALQVAGVRR